MSYNFVENGYPINDPNIDLDFGNNILYKELVEDDIYSYDISYDTKNVIPKKENKNRKIIKYRKKNTNNIYILFIFVIVMLLVIWYIKRNNNNNILDTDMSNLNLNVLHLKSNF